MPAWLTKAAKRWPAATFCVLVYGLVWLLFLAFARSAAATVALLIGSWLPNLAGLLVTALAEGWPGVRRLLGRFAIWRVGIRWYAAALLLPPATVFLAIGLHALSGSPAPTAIPAAMLLPNALFNLILGPLGEELGWRGTLLPRLRSRFGVLTAGLLVGLVWGPFHLPAWLIPDTPQAGVPIAAFLLSTVAFSARVQQSGLPSEVMGVPVLGNWLLVVIYFLCLIPNIVGEECYMRGIILPRQELSYGRWAWLVHGILWTLFHFFQRWTYLQLLPVTLATSYVVSRTKNTTVGIVAHFIGNAILGWLPIIAAVTGIGVTSG